MTFCAKELLDGYNGRNFVLEDGSFDMTTNTTVITTYMKGKGLKLNNTFQDFPNFCTMYPSEYFCPKDHRTGLIHCTKNTVCIHHFSGSWIDHTWWSKTRHCLKYKLTRMVGLNVRIRIFFHCFKILWIFLKLFYKRTHLNGV